MIMAHAEMKILLLTSHSSCQIELEEAYAES